MIKKPLATLILILLVAGCAKQDPGPEQATARGLMKHFPSNVKSSQAWRGHHFTVGDTPVMPTTAVPEAELKRHVGKSVVVTGVWHGGQPWQPGEKEQDFPMPVAPDHQIIIRDDGLKALSIRLIEE